MVLVVERVVEVPVPAAAESVFFGDYVPEEFTVQVEQEEKVSV